MIIIDKNTNKQGERVSLSNLISFYQKKKSGKRNEGNKLFIIKMLSIRTEMH